MTRSERLLRLADLLDADPATWPTDGGKPVEFDLRDWYARDPECGTACCAAGLAALDPAFQAEGLSLTPPVPRESGARSLQYTDPATGRVYEMASALTRFFGVANPFYAGDYREADRTNPKAVAARLREAAGGLARE